MGYQRRSLIVLCAALLSVLPGSAAAKEHRSSAVTREFEREHPCPSTGRTSGSCPGYVKDHVIPLACGGPDAVSNLQWQNETAAAEKDKWERRGCGD